MKNKQKLFLKILAGIVALVLICAILFVTNAFVGNPISSMIANKAIKQYLNQNYSFLDLELEKPVYSFKDGSYIGKAKSKTSMDTQFVIYCFEGKVQGDSYKEFVLRMSNTLNRLSAEYSSYASNIVTKELGYENNTKVMYYKDEYFKLNDKLKLDMEFDHLLPIDSEIIIRMEMEDNSLESIAKVLTDVHKTFVDNRCYFKKYSLSIESNGSLVEISEATPEDIESEELISLLKEAEMGEDKAPVTGIRIFRKGE